MQPAEWLGVWGIVSGIVAVILAIVAIWLSVHFYNQAKGTETNVAQSLADIRAQTATLERLAARQLDRLTRYATQARPEDPSFTALVVTMQQLTEAALAPPKLRPRQAGASGATADHVQAIYNVMYFAAIANIGWNQRLLPAAERSKDDDYIATLVDESNQFFYAHLHTLDSVSPETLEEADIADRLAWVKKELVPYLRTSHTVEP